MIGQFILVIIILMVAWGSGRLFFQELTLQEYSELARNLFTSVAALVVALQGYLTLSVWKEKLIGEEKVNHSKEIVRVIQRFRFEFLHASAMIYAEDPFSHSDIIKWRIGKLDPVHEELFQMIATARLFFSEDTSIANNLQTISYSFGRLETLWAAIEVSKKNDSQEDLLSSEWFKGLRQEQEEFAINKFPELVDDVIESLRKTSQKG